MDLFRGHFPALLTKVAYAVVLIAPLSVTGCGFRPLYEDTAKHAGVSETLKRIYVASIPNRYGQLVRLALQQDMAGAGPEDPDGYTLYVSPSMSNEAVDIHADNTSGRNRVVGRAHWRLFTVGRYPKLLAEGDATTMDGMNGTFEQYFAQSLNTETLQTRVAETLAETVTQQVAIWFETKAPTTKSRKRAPTYYPIPNGIPNSSQEQPVERAGEDGLPAMATGRLDPDSDPTNN
ncbi:hypothetical protein GOB93_09905 [Acetobacter musti]|uniref:Lipoprotein n=1 Tax=Acetobacter musti TaxID=864732 RepID=A0ABX0JTS3_9PROT|nr:hypothetical protein [Acetobacter musti]NHN84954.1 hypothetical protein [Acetobacter musti]